MDNRPNPSSAITAQWALNETADSAISVGKGVLRAATSDNVQPLAIIAADAFGATIAMCRETQMKVEKHAKKNHTSYVVEFLRSSIGYAKDDCAIQLASSNSGLRFLGLAATLLCTEDNFTAAQALELMISSSAGRDQILPTTTQLQGLLTAIEYKLNRVGFAESIVGWETFLTEHPNVPDEFRIYNRLSTDHPSVGGLQALVDALRSLDRLGNASMVRIRAGTCCPWIVAFIKWCLGEPPNVVLEDGTILVDQLQSRVTVVALMKPIAPFIGDQSATMQTEIKMKTARDLDFEIAIYQDLNEPNQLWSCSGRDQKPWFGMVSIENYGRRRLREYNLAGNQALIQAMSFSLKFITTKVEAQHPQHRLTAFSYGNGVLSDAEANREVELPAELAHHRTKMFLGDDEMKCTLCKFFGLSYNEETPLPMLSDGQDVMSLPLVELHVNKLRSSCKCKRCSGDLGSDLAECTVIDFRDVLVQLTAEVIVLSLFDCTEPILILAGSSRDPGIKSLDRNGFVIAIDDLLRGNSRAACSATEIINVALSLIGHNASAELGGRRWIASEARGQVVYPQIFDTATLEPRATLRLGGGPGNLFHEGSKYSMVCGQPEKWGSASRSTRWYEKPVDRPLNLMPTDKLRWQVSKGDGVLYLGCGTTNTLDFFNPHYVLEAVTQSLFLKNCPHPVDKVLNKPDAFSFYTTPVFSLTYGQPVISLTGNQPVVAGSIGVVPVVGNDGLRFFALTNAIPGVIRGSSACMKCCLDLCRKAGLQYVVL